MISQFILGLIFILIVVFNVFLKPKQQNLPPGPRGLPLLGNILQLGTLPYLTLSKWAKEYGEIFQCKFLTKSVFFINDVSLLKEVFQSQGISGRMMVGPPWDFFYDGEPYGLINVEGEKWENVRRFTIKQLRNFGVGKNSMEHLILEEVKETIQLMKSQVGKPLTDTDIKQRLSVGVLNSLWSIIAGKRYSHHDPRLTNMSKLITEMIHDLAKGGNALLFFPWIKNIFPKWSGYISVRKAVDNTVNFLTKIFTEHEEIYSEDHQKDFIDMFLKEIKKTTDPKNTLYGKSGERQLIGTGADLFAAGSDTTSTTLEWIFLYLATFPKIQEKLQREIQEVTKNSRLCSLTDRPNMPYTEAFLSEVLRYSSLVPFAVPHKALADTQVRGYFIPKGMVIIPNLYYIHFNPEIWGDPKTFRPERFLSAGGKVFKKHEALMPFSTGRRQCIGEALAKDSLFLFTTNICQNFTVEFDPTEPNPGLEPVFGMFLSPKPFKVIMKDRTRDH